MIALSAIALQTDECYAGLPWRPIVCYGARMQMSERER
jgi:hypothetical protein